MPKACDTWGLGADVAGRVTPSPLPLLGPQGADARLIRLVGQLRPQPALAASYREGDGSFLIPAGYGRACGQLGHVQARGPPG